MDKGVYTSVDGVARRVKKMYAGVDGIAHKIKKAYRSIGGVARPCFSSEPEYWGTTTSGLTRPRSQLAATTAGNHAFFAGGYYQANDTGYTMNTVDIFDVSLTTITPTNHLSVARYNLAATSVENYALFAGGYKMNYSYDSTVDVYRVNNADVTYISIYQPLGIARERLAATSSGKYAFFAGGINNNGVLDDVDIYAVNNTTITKMVTGLPQLDVARHSVAATSVGNCVFFAGGRTNNGSSDVIEAYTVDGNSVTKIETESIPTLSSARNVFGGVSVGGFALFASVSGTEVDVFNTSFTKITVDSLRNSAQAATSFGDYALFAGESGTEVYDESLTKTIIKGLSESRASSAATMVGNYALFAGGLSGSTFRSTVEVYINSDI